ncbi:hypothetical protein EES39_12625 [Streptomyces sp. ADI92-24]|nr:hypothetical protein EDD95_1151 [Streptomyces sp. CEV 2-1]RPK47032.1 hypothetical protein EES39_12625 [Streptomyces sp. ADI92-24]
MTDRTQRVSDEQTLMTMRVSRDSGRTWEPQKTMRGTDDLPPLLTSAWPPCECHQCRAP